jgi:hypothetical protein
MSPEEFRDFYLAHVTALAPRLKAPAFEDEAEWRIIINRAPGGDPKVKFRLRGNSVAP